MKNSTNLTILSVLEYKKYLIERIDLLEKKLKTMPEGRITFTISHGHLQYYYRPKGSNKSSYLPKKKEAKLNTLANKYYICKLLPKLKANLRAAEKFIALHSGVEEDDIFSKMPPDLQLRNSNIFICKSKIISEWQNRQYTRNPYKPENLIHDTIRGDKVRSKSEAMISNALYAHKLPYLIEYPLRIKAGNHIIYPDFTIMDPTTLEEIYWEHFGMMDNPEYAAEAVKRIQTLHNEGIKLGKNLICTFEASGIPLTSAMIESCIQQFFC